MRFVLAVVCITLASISAAATPWIIMDAGLQDTVQFINERWGNGTLNSRTDLPGNPGTRYSVTLLGTGWDKVAIGDNYTPGGMAVSTANGGDLSQFSAFTMTVRNPNANGWFWAALFMNTGWVPGEPNIYYQSNGVWIGPGQTAILTLDLTTIQRRNHVTNIGIQICSNPGTGDYQMPFGQPFNVDILGNYLSLEVPSESLYVRPGEPATFELYVSHLNQKVNGCQAMLAYSSTYFDDPVGGCITAGGGAWDQVIWDSWKDSTGVPGEIDTAIGVNADGTVGTDADGTVCKITLTSKTGVEGMTQMVFRPDESDVESTFLSDMSSNPVWPNKWNSRLITIDGTAPSVSFTATQGGTNVKTGSPSGTTPVTIQGSVLITVTASDALAGLADVNPVCVTVDGVTTGPVTGGGGTYTCTATVDSATGNGSHQITVTATDKAGNVQTVSDWIYVNKNQVTGTVTLQGYVGGTRDVTFSINGGSLITKSLSFSGDTASYILTNLPDTVTSLSAKAAWNLRKRASDPVNLLDSNGQAAINFLLPAGDINGTNSVNILDYSIMKASWLGSNPVADIDGSGIVNIGDYDLMKLNWFKLGDPL